MRANRRQVTYYTLRAVATLAFVLAAFVMPRGGLAAAVALGAGLVAVLSGIGANAGGPGERAGSRRQMDTYNAIRPPQGDWPPFDPAHDVEGEVVRRSDKLTPP